VPARDEPLGLVEREAERDQAVRFDFVIAISTTVGAVAIGLLQGIAIGVGLSPLLVRAVNRPSCPGSATECANRPSPCIPAHGTLTQGFEMDVETTFSLVGRR